MGHNQKSLGEWSSLYLLTGQLKPEVHVMSLSHLSTLIVKGSTDVGNGTTVLLKQASVHPKKVGPFIWKHELSKTHRRRSRSTRTPRNLKKLKLEPRLGFEILHRLSSINWRLGFPGRNLSRLAFFVAKLACFSGRNEPCPYKNWWPFSLNFAFQNINSRGMVRKSQFNHSKEAGAATQKFIELKGCSVKPGAMSLRLGALKFNEFKLPNAYPHHEKNTVEVETSRSQESQPRISSSLSSKNFAVTSIYGMNRVRDFARSPRICSPALEI